MKLACQVIDPAGHQSVETVEAASANEATDMLRRKGLFVVNVSEGKAAHATKAQARHATGGSKRLRFLISFARQMQVLISTGTPVVQALAAIERQTPDTNYRAIVADVKRCVEEGAPMSEAMQQHPSCFDAVFIGVVAAGEASGNLDGMLGRLVAIMRKQLQLRRTLVGAMTYPLLLSVLAFGVVILMLLFVVPRFAGMFDTLDAELPPTTRFMLALSEGLFAYWWIVAPAFASLIAGGVAMCVTTGGRGVLADWLLRLPRVGPVACDLIAARIMRLLGLLLSSNVTMLETLALVRGAAGHRKFVGIVERAKDMVSKGESLSAAFENSPLVSPSVHEAIRNGEQTGQLGPLLLNVAEFMDEENEVKVRSISALIEPVILIGLGLLVGVLALSMFIPLFDLTAAGGGP